MDISQQQLVATACALLCASIASVHDLRSRRIPNLLCGLALLSGLGLHAIYGGWRGLGESLLAGLIAGGISFLFWIAGGMGAGDVKLLAAVGCMVGIDPLRTLLYSTAITGGIFAVGISLYHGRLRETLDNVAELMDHHHLQGLTPHPELNVKNQGRLSLPFALPIATGCLVAFCTAAWEAHS